MSLKQKLRAAHPNRVRRLEAWADLKSADRNFFLAYAQSLRQKK
jgi:hypothetical protein